MMETLATLSGITWKPSHVPLPRISRMDAIRVAVRV